MGCLYGQAIGNALGIQTEFMSREDVLLKYSSGVTKYCHDAGIWEDDDTNQMLCLLDELVANNQITPQGLASRLLNWLEVDGRGCGNLVYQVLRHKDFLSDPVQAAKERWEHSHREAAPNGALMRTSVVGLWPTDVALNAEKAAMVTHFDPRCVGSCVIASSLIHEMVWQDKELSFNDVMTIGERCDSRIREWVDLAHDAKDISELDLDETHSIGYTLRTLAAALWCYWHAESFESGLLAVVNEGGDADTNAAVACAVLGAKFGYDAIPAYYVDNLHNESVYRESVLRFIAEALLEFNR